MRSDCGRQLRLLIATDAEREAEDMPDEQPPRPGLEHLAQLGIEWQHEKVTDLSAEFGEATLIAEPRMSRQTGRTTYGNVDMATALGSSDASAHVTWIVEGTFPTGAIFRAALNIPELEAQFPGLDFADLRPDLVQVAHPGTFSKGVEPSGSLFELQDDAKRQLRVIDIKLTAEPSAAYFTEVVLYSMALAGWLEDEGLDEQFVVAADAALWPGSHDASALRQVAQDIRDAGGTPTPIQLLPALDEELEVVPFEVFSPRVRAFFERDLQTVLSKPWRELDWHVDNHCKGCPFLGAPWMNADGHTWDPERRHCIQMAEDSGHLSRIAYVSRGARTALDRAGVEDVASLSQRTSDDAAFDDHHVLRSTRTVVPERAGVLQEELPALVAPDSGTSATMPRWADLRINISVDFDVSSAISFAFGATAFVLEPVPFGATAPAERRQNSWSQVFTVDQRDPAVEEREFLAFLAFLSGILEWSKNEFPDATVQFYIWDELQQKHLARVVGRHLEAILSNQNAQNLAWLFPSEELLANPNLASRKSPITVVRDVIRSVLAAPVAHYYSLLEIARIYHREGLPDAVASFSVHPMFEDPLSDQIPSERAHDIWTRSTDERRYWRDQLNRLDETVTKRLKALETVRQRLEDDLRPILNQQAPKIGTYALGRLGAVSVDSELWYSHAKLNAALADAEASQIRAMPPHEREARFHSAFLETRLSDAEEAEALDRLGVQPRPELHVYRLGPHSREVKARKGDFNFAISPRDQAGLLDQKLKFVVKDTRLANLDIPWSLLMASVFSVTVEEIDREGGVIVLSTSDYWPDKLRCPTLIDDLRDVGIDLTTDVMLDRVETDFFCPKLKTTLKAIGNPPGAATNPLIRRALGHSGRGPRRTSHVPAADFLWNAKATHEAMVIRDVAAAREVLDRESISLNQSQWVAWEQALTRRLQPIWGPPGTGKSRTLRAVVLGAVAAADISQNSLRILVSASTYKAIDNVLLEAADSVTNVASNSDIEVHRLRSQHSEPPENLNNVLDRTVNRRDPSDEEHALRERLTQSVGITIVGGTPEQLHNLMAINDDQPMAGWFDLVVFDEASQTDVAHATLPLAAVAAGGSLVPAGDSKQLPPIHQAEPPAGLEELVGSLMSFLEDEHEISPLPLTENYRSNETIVEFARQGGYPADLESVAPSLRLRLLDAPTEEPEDWPDSLVWTPEWDYVLDPDQPTVAFIYDDQEWSSQWNQFEAEAVASLVVALRSRLAVALSGQIDPRTGEAVPEPDFALMSDEQFWNQGVGVVTPHRAQQALVVSALQRGFPTVPGELIRGAVDTVERFQGQERDVIFVSYALGDVDAIREEEEFLLGFNRFNVAISRARAKVVVLASAQVVEHLSDDVKTLRGSKLLKLYTNSFTNCERGMALPYRDRNGDEQEVSGQFRWRD